MCEFLSWIEKDDKVYYLTSKQIYETLRGKQLQRFCGDADDHVGHGAIRFYYRLAVGEGKNKECTDFSTPANFPTKIAQAVKDMKFRGMATPSELLTEQAWAEYEKVTEQALAEYDKVRQPAYTEHEKVRQQAYAEYEKIRRQAWVEYNKVTQPALAEYDKVTEQAWVEYNKVTQPAYAEHDRVRQQAWAEYEKVKQQAFWDLFAVTESRKPKWR